MYRVPVTLDEVRLACVRADVWPVECEEALKTRGQYRLNPCVVVVRKGNRFTLIDQVSEHGDELPALLTAEKRATLPCMAPGYVWYFGGGQVSEHQQDVAFAEHMRRGFRKLQEVEKREHEVLLSRLLGVAFELAHS